MERKRRRESTVGKTGRGREWDRGIVESEKDGGRERKREMEKEREMKREKDIEKEREKVIKRGSES